MHIFGNSYVKKNIYIKAHIIFKHLKPIIQKYKTTIPEQFPVASCYREVLQ